MALIVDFRSSKFLNSCSPVLLSIYLMKYQAAVDSTLDLQCEGGGFLPEHGMIVIAI